MDFLAERLIGKIGGSDAPQTWVGLNQPTAFSRSCGIWLTKVGLRQFKEGFCYDPTAGRRHYEWGAVIDGQMELTADGVTTTVKEGMYYCMPDSAAYFARSDAPFTLVWLEADGPLCSQLFSMLSAAGLPVMANYNYDHLLHALRITHLLSHRPDQYIMQSYTALWNFISAFYPKERLPDPELQSITNYIHLHAQDPQLDLESLAMAAHMSVETFRKRFAACMGKAPMQYVLQTRLMMAKEMLSDSDKTVRQIAFACGFSDPYYFSRAFKKSEGISPARFRKEVTIKNA